MPLAARTNAGDRVISTLHAVPALPRFAHVLALMGSSCSRRAEGRSDPDSMITESSIKLWDVRTWQASVVLSRTQVGLGLVRASDDDRLLAITAADDVVEIFDLHSRETVRKLANGVGSGSEMAFSPDGKWFASFSQDGVGVWNIAEVRR
jgi:WD40 repeat protein